MNCTIIWQNGEIGVYSQVIYDLQSARQSTPFNTVPSFPVKMDPPAQIFVWGTGKFGQFGMGPSYLDEVSKPTRNTWVEEKMAQGVFGSGPGSGIVGVAVGVYIRSHRSEWHCMLDSFHCYLLNVHHLTRFGSVA